MLMFSPRGVDETQGWVEQTVLLSRCYLGVAMLEDAQTDTTTRSCHDFYIRIICASKKGKCLTS